MSEWSYKSSPAYYPSAVATKRGWETKTTNGEVLVSIPNLNTKNTQALLSNTITFTLAVPANATYNTGTVITFTVTPSTAVTVLGTPSINLTFTSGTVSAYYDAASSTSTSLKFKYTVKAGDLSLSGITVSNGLTQNYWGDKLQSISKLLVPVTGTRGAVIAQSRLTFSVPATTGIIIN